MREPSKPTDSDPVIPELLHIQRCLRESIDLLEALFVCSHPGLESTDRRTVRTLPAEVLRLNQLSAGRRLSGRLGAVVRLAQLGALERQLPTAVLCRDHTPTTLVLSLWCKVAAVELHAALGGELDDPAFARLTDAAARLAGAPLYFLMVQQLTLRQRLAAMTALTRHLGVEQFILNEPPPQETTHGSLEMTALNGFADRFGVALVWGAG